MTTAIALLSLLLCGPAHAAKKPATRVHELSGGTLQADGKYLVEGDKLPYGKTATLERGAKLVLDTGRAQLLLRGPAVFSTSFTDEEESVDLKTGGVLALVASALGRRFTVRTPAATMAVRGTTFFAETRGSYETYLCLCDGIMEVTSDKLAFKSAVVSDHKHTGRLFKMGGASGQELKAPMSGHTNAETAELVAVSRRKKR